MVSPTLLAAGSVSIGVGVSFAAVSRATGQRTASGAGQTAMRAFSLWWGAMAAYLVVHGALTLLASFDALPAALYAGSRWVLIPVLCAAVWGLTTYLLYLYTGQARWFRVAAVFYGAVALLFYLAHALADGPDLIVEKWLVTTDDSGPLYQVVYGLVGVPPIAGAIAYLALLRRVEEPEQRYRIVLVSASILAYVGAGLVARLVAQDLWIFVTLVIFGAFAAAASLLAYYPPASVTRRWRQPA